MQKNAKRAIENFLKASILYPKKEPLRTLCALWVDDVILFFFENLFAFIIKGFGIVVAQCFVAFNFDPCRWMKIATQPRIRFMTLASKWKVSCMKNIAGWQALRYSYLGHSARETKPWKRLEIFSCPISETKVYIFYSSKCLVFSLPHGKFWDLLNNWILLENAIAQLQRFHWF